MAIHGGSLCEKYIIHNLYNMKLKLMMLSLTGALALTASAQTEGAKATRVVYDKSTPDNWFITLQGGVSILGNGGNPYAKFEDRLTFTPSVAVGKWHNPYYATRIKAQVGEAVSFFGRCSARTKHSNKFVAGHYDFMLDLTNYFGRFDRNYFLHVIPYVGVGYEYKFDSSLRYDDTHAATATTGLQLAMRLAKRVDLVLEGEATWNGLHLSKSYPVAYENNLRLGASAGLTFRLGKVGFTPVKALDEVAVADLQSRINALRAENAELSKRPTHCPELAPAPVASDDRFLAEKSILFRHGKSNVSDDQLITVFDAAEFVKKYNGEVIVTGYAQSSESRFASLAEQRAQAVAKILTEKYGVPSQNITIEYKSASEAPFAGKSQAWNRVVIIRSK